MLLAFIIWSKMLVVIYSLGWVNLLSSSKLEKIENLVLVMRGLVIAYFILDFWSIPKSTDFT